MKLNTFVFKRVLFSQPLYVVSALVKPTLIPIPYRIYQPKRAGNLPIPANPPVNKWDATLVILGVDEVCGSGVFTCHVYDDALIIFQRAWMWTRQPERLEDVCAAHFYSGVETKESGQGCRPIQSSGCASSKVMSL